MARPCRPWYSLHRQTLRFMMAVARFFRMPLWHAAAFTATTSAVRTAAPTGCAGTGSPMAGRLTAVVTATAAEQQSAATAACDALWNYRGVRRGERRESRWIGTAVAEKDGRRWVDLAVGDRSENTFLRWYDRLTVTAAVYCSGRYAVYRRLPQDRRCRAKEEPASRAALLLIRDRRCVGKGGAVNWNAGLHSAFEKQAESADEGYTKSVAMLVYYPAPVCGRQEAKSNICGH